MPAPLPLPMVAGAGVGGLSKQSPPYRLGGQKIFSKRL